MVQQALNTVCETYPGCETLAYADLSTQLVLATNAGTPLSRDDVNQLCAEASIVLQGGHLALVGTETQFRIFLRDPEVETDGLICVCGLDTDIDGLLPAARKCLSDISGGDAS